MRLFIFLALFCFTLSLYSQPLLTIGATVGYSEHAGSFKIDELFRVREFSGLRTLQFESKLGWTFFDMTSLYAVGKASIGSDSVSPYHHSGYGGGIDQKLTKWLYVSANYGKFVVNAGQYGRIADGKLLTLGVGFRFNKQFSMELQRTSGAMNNYNSYLIPSERMYSVHFAYYILN